MFAFVARFLHLLLSNSYELHLHFHTVSMVLFLSLCESIFYVCLCPRIIKMMIYFLDSARTCSAHDHDLR